VGDTYQIPKNEEFVLPIQSKAGTIRFSNISDQASDMDTLPPVRHETKEDDLSNNQFVFGLSEENPRLSEFIRQHILTRNPSATFDNFQFIRLSQDSETINSRHPNLMIGIVLMPQRNLSEITIYYSTREEVSEASKKLATTLYNGILQRVHTNRAHLSQKQNPYETTLSFHLDEIKAPTVVIGLSQDLYQALGDAEFGELMGNAIYTYYTT